MDISEIVVVTTGLFYYVPSVQLAKCFTEVPQDLLQSFCWTNTFSAKEDSLNVIIVFYYKKYKSTSRYVHH